MAKTELTQLLEDKIQLYISRQGVFGCLEVTIGWYGKQRVDFVTMGTNNIFRCYELKISKLDFHSKHDHNFVGNYNYYVMPTELYEEVRDEIPKEIGVIGWTGTYLEITKKPKRQELKVDIDVLKKSMIRSLHRDVEKAKRSCDINLINKYKSRTKYAEKQTREAEIELLNYKNKLYKHFGRQEYNRLQELLDL